MEIIMMNSFEFKFSLFPTNTHTTHTHLPPQPHLELTSKAIVVFSRASWASSSSCLPLFSRSSVSFSKVMMISVSPWDVGRGKKICTIKHSVNIQLYVEFRPFWVCVHGMQVSWSMNCEHAAWGHQQFNRWLCGAKCLALVEQLYQRPNFGVQMWQNFNNPIQV